MTQAATERPVQDRDRAASTPRANGLAHEPALDGLRCLAVVAVLVFHQGFGVGERRVPRGRRVLRALRVPHHHAARDRAEREGGIGLRAFWGRRAKRLLPAMFVLLAVVAFYAAFFAQGTELARIRSDALRDAAVRRRTGT